MATVSVLQSTHLLESELARSVADVPLDDLLISSPYTTPEHHLELSSVPETSQQLALALQILRPIVKDYPTQSYSTSFNWQEIINLLPSNFTGSPSPYFN
jgi:hypothetical protein